MCGPSKSLSHGEHARQEVTSTVYWCIASKLIVPLFFMEWKTRFCVLIYHFSISLTLAVLQRQKPYRILAVLLPFKMSAAWLPWDSQWSLASTRWAMSLYIKFRAIYFWLLNEYWWWDEAKIYHIIRQLSHRFMCEIMIWSGDKKNWYTKNISTKLRLRPKT